MAGYYNRLHNDLGYQIFQDHIDRSFSDYNLNVPAHFRGPNPPQALSHGLLPDFYGPVRGLKTTQESFLQGRGQTLSECPSCDVIWLPQSVFPPNEGAQAAANAACQRTDLDPLQSRMPRQCNGLMETDVTQYWWSPSAWQRGWQGVNAVVQTNLQTRQPPTDPGLASIADGNESFSCRANYGTYGTGANFARYVWA